MIIFKQKKFAIPAIAMGALNAAGTVAAVAGMKQSADQAKEAEEQAEKQREAIEKQTKALNKIAKEAKSNPEVADKVQKEFAVTPLIKNVAGFAKDVWGTQKSNVGKAAKAGLGFGALGWAGNRLTTSIKDHDEEHDEKNRSFLKKAALGAATIGGGILAAKKGVLGKSAQEFMTKGAGSKALTATKEAINPIVRDPKTGSISKGQTAMKVGMNGVFVGMPVMGYLGQKKQQDDQVQKSYSDRESSGLLKGLAGAATIAGTVALGRKGMLGTKVQRGIGNITAHTGGILKSVGATKAGDKLAKSGANTFAQGFRDKNGNAVIGAVKNSVANKKYNTAAAPNKISDGISKAGSFLGFYGKGGTKAVQNTANTLAKSDNQISKNVGEFLQKHKTTANVAGGVGALAVGGTVMGAGEKPFKVLDSHAYDYEKQQNQEVR